MKYRVVYDQNLTLGRHQYFIEYDDFSYPGKYWQRLGGGYSFDFEDQAIKACDDLNEGKKIIYEPKDSA